MSSDGALQGDAPWQSRRRPRSDSIPSIPAAGSDGVGDLDPDRDECGSLRPGSPHGSSAPFPAGWLHKPAVLPEDEDEDEDEPIHVMAGGAGSTRHMPTRRSRRLQGQLQQHHPGQTGQGQVQGEWIETSAGMPHSSHGIHAPPFSMPSSPDQPPGIDTMGRSRSGSMQSAGGGSAMELALEGSGSGSGSGPMEAGTSRGSTSSSSASASASVGGAGDGVDVARRRTRGRPVNTRHTGGTNDAADADATEISGGG